jgi:Raf kinase inhibitor-like YbhB/YbcL family protein
MEIRSPVFANHQSMPARYTCMDENISPPLEFFDLPEKTKSLALIVEDPDAPTANFTHWLVLYIPPSVNSFEENQVPGYCLEGINDAGKIGYSGPCPPSGIHHYNFQLYALDILLSLPSGSSKEKIKAAMENHIINSAELIGLFSKS